MALPSDTTATIAAPKRSFKKTIVEFAIVTIIATGIGFGSFKAKQAADAKPSHQVEAEDGSPKESKSNLIELPPIVTNIGSPKDVWVRFEAVAVIDPKAAPRPDAVISDVAGDILAYLRTASLAQLEGPIGLQNLRQEINERAALRSEGKISEIVIRTLVVQ